MDRRAYDPVIETIAEYAARPPEPSALACATARLDLLDSLGCGILALRDADCRRHVGPVVPGAEWADGARIPGTRLHLDPVQAARSLASMIRWLDYNDTWLAAEWGHPSDNLGAILPMADWLSRTARRSGRPTLPMRRVLHAMIQAHEIQGVLALDTSLNRVGVDHVLFVAVASAAVCAALLGADARQIAAAVSSAFLDGGPLRTYRHAPNTGWRKSWAAGDACARGVRLALLAADGEMGYPTALSARTWGFEAVVMDGRPVTLARPLGCYVMEHVLFKVDYPAEFHGQTAVEAAIRLSPQVAPRLDQVDEVILTTQESAIRIIDKTGPLSNPADRDHCLQYMTAVALIHGRLTPDLYGDAAASDPRIDALRARMRVVEDPRYSRDYLDPERRSIANAVEVRFTDGTVAGPVAVEYPLGHRRRRDEARPRLLRKFAGNAAGTLPEQRIALLTALATDPDRLDAMAVDDYVALWLPAGDSR
jgi:2-methylcitrate dehydratase